MEQDILLNPLLCPSDAVYGAPRFDKIENSHYIPAFREAIREAKTEINHIVENPEPPTFENTIVALEYAGMTLNRVENIFFNLLEADSDQEKQNIAETISPELTEFSMYISLNDDLFKKVKSVYENPGDIDVSGKKLLEDTYRSFVRGGAALQYEDREQYRKWCEELSLLELKFSNNVLAATNNFILHLNDEAELEGLPEYVKDSGRMAAKERDLDGWVITLHYPSFAPFMKYSSRRDLRERLYMAYASKSLGGEYDNSKNIFKIISLRQNISNILGYEDYASYALEKRMAKNRDNVMAFLEKLMTPSLPAARIELQDIFQFAKEHGFEDEMLQPWDFQYWSEKWKQAKYDLDEQLLKPYFRLENCIDSVLGLAGKLYGISFEERTDIPTYHPDVKVFDVKDEHGEHLALFYADFFPRASKRGGAWMTSFREQYSKDGQDYRPFISIVTNFSKPGSDAPSLLTHDELTTFLHEFGHALHGMLSRGVYPSQCGTNVARDFVELPSQIMENWAFETEFLDGFARHYQTGEKIPSEYIDRIVKAKNCLAAYLQVRQLHFGYLDMAWHSQDLTSVKSVEVFENQVLDKYKTLPFAAGTSISTSFGHIFSGGYSAGYYSYKWAEVLEADAFSFFEEKGLFGGEAADKFKKIILERGSSEDEDILYRRFRGHDPNPEALLVKLGIQSPTS